ncbi:hypothetical protein ACFQFQ_09115 [Sulfitobacter porphyrae]|uniref:Uncharacterized protein n=1 Tax=Sulfitobacter porphyrae TaxID=1246864 RepID=A0ABW2B208_9RHOB
MLDVSSLSRNDVGTSAAASLTFSSKKTDRSFQKLRRAARHNQGNDSRKRRNQAQVLPPALRFLQRKRTGVFKNSDARRATIRKTTAESAGTRHKRRRQPCVFFKENGPEFSKTPTRGAPQSGKRQPKVPEPGTSAAASLAFSSKKTARSFQKLRRAARHSQENDSRKCRTYSASGYT